MTRRKRVSLKAANLNTAKRVRGGAALVEMALVMTVFTTLVLGVVEIGRALWVHQMLITAAREGARLAIIDGTTESEVTGRVADIVEDTIGVRPADSQISVVVDGGRPLSEAPTGTECQVVVRVPFSEVSFLTPQFLSETALEGTCTMRHE